MPLTDGYFLTSLISAWIGQLTIDTATGFEGMKKFMAKKRIDYSDNRVPNGCRKTVNAIDKANVHGWA